MESKWNSKKPERSRSFTKKVTTTKNKNDGNFGWRGASDSFQSKTENHMILKHQNSGMPIEESVNPPFQRPPFDENMSTYAESRGIPKAYQSEPEYNAYDVNHAYSNSGSSSLGSNAYDSYGNDSGAFSQPEVPYGESKIGNIRVNQINADKININGGYRGKVNVNGYNAFSNSERARLMGYSDPTGGPLSGDYRSRINVNTDVVGSRINISEGSYGYGSSSLRDSGIVIRPDSIKESQIRFNSDVGFSSGAVTQQNLLSADQKLKTANVDIRKLSSGDIKSIAQGGTIRGRRVSLTSEERQTLQAYIQAKENPKSFSTLTNGGEIGGFRKKGSNPLATALGGGNRSSKIGNIRIEENQAEIGNIQINGNNSYNATNGRIMAPGQRIFSRMGAGSGALMGGAGVANALKSGGLGATGILGANDGLLGGAGETTGIGASGIPGMPGVGGLASGALDGVSGAGGLLDNGGSKIRVIKELNERSFGGTRGIGKILITNGDNATGSRSLKNVMVSDSNIISNFRINNLIGTGRDSKIAINGSLLGGAGKTQKSLRDVLNPTKSVFSKYTNFSFLSNKITGMGHSMMSGLAGFPGLIGGGGIFGSSKLLISGVLVGSLVMGNMSFASDTLNVFIPNNNYVRKDDSMLAGAVAPENNLQKILDELDFKQRAYEYNLVYCDKETEGIYGLAEDSTETKKYYDYGIPDSWKEQMENLEGNAKWLPKCDIDKKDEKLTVTRVYKFDGLLGIPTSVLGANEIMGYRLGGHFWGPSREEWGDSEDKTCVYPEPDGPADVPNYEKPGSDGYDGKDALEEFDKAHKGDNMIRVWSRDWDEEIHDWVYHDTYKPMYLYCIGGLEGDAGEYTTGDLEDGHYAHVKHDSDAVKNQKRKEYQPDYNNFLEEGDPATINYPEPNLGGKENNNITVEYKYEGSRYSYLFTDDKVPCYKTSDNKHVSEEDWAKLLNSDKAPPRHEAITYDTYEFYRALIACGEGFVHNGEENYKYLNEYMDRLFEKAMSNATIELVPDNEEKPFEQHGEADERKIYWKYIDDIGHTYEKPGKNDTCPDNGDEWGVSYCSSPTYDFHVKIVITIHDSGVQDLMKLDEELTDNEVAHKPMIKRVIEAIKNVVYKILSWFSDDSEGGGTDEMPKKRMFIDEEYMAEHPAAKPHYSDWVGWFKEHEGDEELKVSPGFLSDEVERNTTQMRYAVELVEFDKEDFDDIYEGIHLPTSSILWDIVPDVSDDEIDAGDAPAPAPGPGYSGVGESPIPTVREGGVMLDNLRYINQGRVSFKDEVRYIRDDKSISYFRNSGCLDSSIMMIYYHYYAANAGSIDDGEIFNLWKSRFKPTIPNGSGALGTSTVISGLGLTASGAHYVSKEGWDLAIDALYAGNPILLHIAGPCSTGLTHKSSNGHFLVIIGCDDQNVYVYDPGCAANTGKPIPWSDPCWKYYMSNGSLYYKIYGATGAYGRVARGGRTPYTPGMDGGGLSGIHGGIMYIPAPGEYINVKEINTQKDYTLMRTGTDSYSMQGTMRDASEKGWWAYDRIMDAASTATSNNIGRANELLTLTKGGETYYVASIVDGYSTPGNAYRVTLNTGQTFNVFSADVKSLADPQGSGGAGQIDSNYGHGYIQGSSVQMNIVEFFDARTDSMTEYSTSAKNYSNTPVSDGTYVTKVESLGVF